MVVWADSFENIMPLCQDLEEKLIKLVWRNRHSLTPAASADVSERDSTVASDVNVTDSTVNEGVPITEKAQAATHPASKPKSAWRWNWRLTPKSVEPPPSDPEKDGPAKKDPRPIRLYAPFYCGFAVALSICMVLHALLLSLSSLSPCFQSS